MNAARAAPRPTSRETWQPISLAIYVVLALVGGTIALRWQVGSSLPAGQSPHWADFVAPLWTILIGILSTTACAILGCYLVLRRMSLLGDAISHAVLPGLAVAFLLTGELNGWPMFLGAMALGVATSALTQLIAGWGKVSEDASMGVVFTSLFALGVVLIMAFARNVDLDVDCILYGKIDLTPTDLPPPDRWQVPIAVWPLSVAMLVTLAFVSVLWKELKIVSFDPALAAAMGISVPVVHYALMAMVAGVSITSFDAVGAILVVAMLIVPAATAALVTDRLVWMLAWAIAFGITAAIFGYVSAAAFETLVAAMMAVVAGLQLAGAVFFGPQHGLVFRWLRNLALAVRIASEDVIGRLYREEERGAGIGVQGSGFRVQGSAVRGRESGVGGLVQWLAGWRIARADWVTTDGSGAARLTDTGRTAARNLVRAHRLWETYLDTHFDLPRDHLHDAAERMEHFLDPELQAELDAELAGVATDPHGKAIPPPLSVKDN